MSEAAGPICIIAVFAAFWNFAHWAVYHDGWDYVYAGSRNGLWAVLWSVVAIIAGALS